MRPIFIILQNRNCLHRPITGAVQAVFLCYRGGWEGLFCRGVDSPTIRYIGFYRLLILTTLKHPIAKKTALTNNNDNSTMN